jgi:transposase
MPPKTDPEKQARFAELVARGCTQHEAARAVGVAPSTGERWLTNPRLRELVEQTRDRLGGKSDDLALLDELAQDDDSRVRLAALLLKQKLGLFDKGEEPEETDLPDGAYIVYRKPRPEAERETSSR